MRWDSSMRSLVVVPFLAYRAVFQRINVVIHFANEVTLHLQCLRVASYLSSAGWVDVAVRCDDVSHDFFYCWNALQWRWKCSMLLLFLDVAHCLVAPLALSITLTLLTLIGFVVCFAIALLALSITLSLLTLIGFFVFVLLSRLSRCRFALAAAVCVFSLWPKQLPDASACAFWGALSSSSRL
jgi:hypothetical protein